jgi:hypothetical protein
MNLRDMDKASTISAIGHLGVILWAVMGDWLFAPKDMPPIEVAEVSLLTEGEFQAMMASAPKPDPAAQPTEEPPVVEAPEPIDTTLPEPPPEPAQDTPAEPVPVEEILPDTVPVSPDPQPVAVPEPAPQVAEEEQPIPVPESSIKPKPRPAQRITDVPVESPVDTPEVADTVTPEVSDQAQPDAEVVETTEPAAAPEESAAMVAPDATESDAPELAPTASRRPQSRPERQVQAEDAPEPDTQAAETPTEQTDAEAEAIAAALAEAAATDTASTQTGLPEGPPMTAGEKDGVRVAINSCWNIGSLSSAAQRVKLVMRVEMNEDGTPIAPSITMTSYEGGDDAAAQQAFEAAKRAVVRGVRGCGGKPGYQLDPAKYGEWNVMNLTFDASGMRLR